MSSLNLYLKTKHEFTSKQINLVMSSIIGGSYQLEWNVNHGTLILEQFDNQYVNLKLSFKAISYDLQDELTAVIVPRFEDEIYKCVMASSKTGLYYFTEELPTLLKKDLTLREKLLSFTEEVSDDVLLTIKAYLELNMSVNLVARTMYTHRNTINYRISRFIELTGIDIRATTNGYYVYLLITWNNQL